MIDKTPARPFTLARPLTLVLALALALPVAVPPALAAGAALEPAAGTWSGKGWVKRDAESGKEMVRCRLTSTYEASRLSIEGKCAASGTMYPVKGYVEEGASGFAGRWYSPTSSAVAPLTGDEHGNAVRLTFTFPATEDRAAVTGRLEWTRGTNKMVLTSSGETGAGKTGSDETGALSRIVFER